MDETPSDVFCFFQLLIPSVSGAANGSISAASRALAMENPFLQELFGPATWVGATLPVAFQTPLMVGLPANSTLTRKSRQAFNFQASDFFQKPETPDWAIKKAWNKLRHPNQIFQARRARRQSARYTTEQLGRLAKQLDEAPPTLAQIFHSHQPKLSTLVNTHMGAVAVPKGLMFLASSKIYFFFALDAIIPHWQPKEIRHPAVAVGCNNHSPEFKEACHRLLDNIMANRDCPQTKHIQKTVAQITAEFRATYEGVLSPGFGKALMKDFCSNDHACAIDTDDQPLSFLRSTLAGTQARQPRFIAEAAVGFAALTSLIGTVIGGYSLSKVNGLGSQIEMLDATMRNHSSELANLLNGTQRLTQMTNSHFTYMKESLLNIYADIEGTRCLGVTDLRNFQQAVHLDLLRMHLRETMK